MGVVVRLDSRCQFEIGERTPEKRAFVKEYVKAWMGLAGEHAGRPPGSRASRSGSPKYQWTDANWRIGYTLERSGNTLTVTVRRVKLRGGGDSSS